jgi:ABC-2 type transport system ATP-binding protein
MSANAIEIRGLEKAFPAFALGPLDLTVPAGAIYGFVGPNGSGKTTTIDLIFAMGAKDAGSIRVLGLDHLRDEVAMKRQVAYVSPDLMFHPWGRVRKVIQFVRGFYPTWDQAYCERLMTSLDLGADDKISTLSFGARIKLSLLLALAWRPKVLILDEPTVGLDAISKQAVFAELLAAVRMKSARS